MRNEEKRKATIINEEERERVRVYAREYYKNHHDRIKKRLNTPEVIEHSRAVRRKYYETVIKPKKIAMIQWRENNRERDRELKKQYYEKNREEILKQSAVAYEENKAVWYMNIIGVDLEDSDGEPVKVRPMYKKKKITATQRRIDQRVKLNRAIDMKADAFRAKLALEASLSHSA